MSKIAYQLTFILVCASWLTSCLPGWQVTEKVVLAAGEETITLTGYAYSLKSEWITIQTSGTTIPDKTLKFFQKHFESNKGYIQNPRGFIQANIYIGSVTPVANKKNKKVHTIRINNIMGKPFDIIVYLKAPKNSL